MRQGLWLGLVAVTTVAIALPGWSSSPDQVVSRVRPDETETLPPGLALLELPPLNEATPFLPDLERKLVLRLRERRVYLYVGAEIQASYPVAVGKPGWETPVGTFKVLYKVKNPTWQNPFNGYVIPPGPANPLGDRLIVFTPIGNKGYAGFHGTTNESLIGQAVSHGCVRMKNNDIRALFESVELGTPIIVTP